MDPYDINMDSFEITNAIQTLYDYHVKVTCCYPGQGDRSYVFTPSTIGDSPKDNAKLQRAREIMRRTLNRQSDYIKLFQ